MAFTPNFIFSDAVPAQQAVQYAQIAAGQQAAQDQAFNERMRNATQGRISQQNAQQQMLLNQNQMAQRAAEAEKDRGLAREGYVNAQTVAGITAGRPVGGGTFAERQAAEAKARLDDQKQKHETGKALALILINPNVPESEKMRVRETALKSGLITVNQRGYYMPAFEDPYAPKVESISSILSKRAGMGPSATSITPVPSPGFQPRATDFNVPVEYPGGPETYPAPPVAPTTSPFETPGFKTFRQSDFTNPQPEAPVDQPWYYDNNPGY